MQEWKERTGMLVGEEMLKHFADSTVAVIGVGGVGGYAAEMLVRAGIGHLIILDSDVVSVTNKNRQLLALDSTVGKPKCEVLAAMLKYIN
ncbi:MAG: ThiF family adenylyltransferase, partial [Bacteroidales bacterium]|nr:ThiF family adenylyltransferase [Bacteroidales bacterium]